MRYGIFATVHIIEINRLSLISQGFFGGLFAFYWDFMYRFCRGFKKPEENKSLLNAEYDILL